MMMVMAVFMTWNLYGLQALSELELYGVVGDAGAVLLTLVIIVLMMCIVMVLVMLAC